MADEKDPRPSIPPVSGTTSTYVSQQQWPYEALAAQPPGMSSALIHWLSSASQQLLAQAQDITQRGETRFALILAQAACEMYTEEALGNLIRRRTADPILGKVMLDLAGDKMTLANGKVHDYYSALTGDYPRGHSKLQRPPASWWADWLASRELRNTVAHQSAPATLQQAANAIAAAHNYINHIARAVDSSPKTIP
jgi:hypothetical protein